MTGTVATQAFVAGAAGAQTLAMGDAADPEHQPCWYQSPLLTRRIGHKRVCLAKESKAGPSQEQKEEVEQEGTTQSLSLRELWDMQRDFSHHPGEQVIT